METKKNGSAKRQVTRTVQNIALALMVLVVIALTASVIALFALNAAFEGDDAFDLDRFTAGKADNGAQIGEHLLPSFIGIRAKGEQRGISAGYNTVYDLYEMFAPVLRDVLSDQFREVSAERFGNAVNSSSFVYMKYHTPIPWQAVYACAGGMEESYDASVSVYELVILPDQGFRILVRTLDGKVYLFEGTYKSYFTVETLAEFMSSYQRNMADFAFSQGEVREPHFTERIRTKNMLVTERTAALIQNRESHIAAILRLMDFNPDKLYAHEESDIGFVYVENHGVLRLLDESVEYTAASSDGGIPVELFTGQYGSAGHTLGDYLAAACIMVSEIKELSAHYAGGDADILLESVHTDSHGTVTLQFMYTFDNLRLSGCEPALVIRFKGGRMTDMRLFSVSARNLGVQEDSLLEQWYYDTAEANCPEGWFIADVSPVYRTDFYAESISAQWTVVYGTREQVTGDYEIPNRIR